VGLGGLFMYLLRMHTYLTDDPSACVNCHIMSPYYATWSHSSHGRDATCNDCHVPHQNLFMKYLLLVSHGGFAQGLKTSLAMFAEDKVSQVIAVGLENGKSVDDFAETFRQALSNLKDEDSVVVLADIVGGSPLTTACNVLADLGKLDDAIVLGGMNLPMAVNAVVMKDMLEGQDFVTTVLGEAKSALQEFRVTSDEEDDDDI